MLARSAIGNSARALARPQTRAAPASEQKTPLPPTHLTLNLRFAFLAWLPQFCGPLAPVTLIERPNWLAGGRAAGRPMGWPRARLGQSQSELPHQWARFIRHWPAQSGGGGGNGTSRRPMGAKCLGRYFGVGHVMKRAKSLLCWPHTIGSNWWPRAHNKPAASPLRRPPGRHTFRAPPTAPFS